ncbi:MAG: adenylate/guanylate cyclase domain-containing protein, partial [Pseudomonadota bacterium]
MTGLVLGLYWLNPGGIRQVEEVLFDQYQRWEPRPYDPETPVRLIDIDEESLRRFGQWPWPRTYMAELTRRLNALQAGAIGFDMVFAEPDRTSPAQLAKGWGRFGDSAPLPDLTGLPDHDADFAAALAGGPNVLGMAGSPTETPHPLVLKSQISFVGDDATGALEPYAFALTNLPSLSNSAAGVGIFSTGTLKGERVRRLPLVVTVGDRMAAALTMEVLRVAQGAGSNVLKTTGAQSEVSGGEVQVVALRSGALEVPLTTDGFLRIRYSGSQPKRAVPAWRILEGDTVDLGLSAEITGRLLIVGASAATLEDLIATPFADSVPGMEVHAEILEQVIAQDFLSRPDWASGLEGLAVLLFGLLATFLGAWQRPALSLLLTGGLCAAAAAGSWLAFRDEGLLLSPVFPLLTAALIYVALTGLGIFLKDRERRAVRDQFAHFIPGELIAEIAAHPDETLTPSGAARELTVMFIDIRKFSTITESMGPETVVEFVNDFLTPLSDMILDREGTIDKFIGDAVMAFWNAPTQNLSHRERAIETALAMPEVMNRINQGFVERGLPEIEAGAGVNTGSCAVGFMGSRRRLGYTTIGDPVNLASRLEGMTKQYGAPNCLGEATVEGLEDRFALIPLDLVAVKGRRRPEQIHCALGAADMLTDPSYVILRQTIDQAQAAYLARDWDAAQQHFMAMSQMSVGAFNAQQLAATFLVRVQEFRE